MKKLLAALISVGLITALLFTGTVFASTGTTTNTNNTSSTSSTTKSDDDEDAPVDAKLYVQSYGKSIFQAGDVVNVPMTIASRIDGYAENIRFNISGSGDNANDFSLDEPTGWYQIGYISKKVQVTPTLRVASGVADGRYKLVVTFQYADVNDNIFTSTDEIIITVAGRSADTPYIKSAVFASKEIGKENKSKLNVSIFNPMSASIWNVNVGFVQKGSDNFSLYANQLPVNISSISAGQSANASFSIYVGTSVATGNYPIVFNLSYKDAGGTVNTLTQTIYVQVVRSSDVGNDKSSQPRIIISKYSTDVSQIQAGKGFTLNFALQNTSAKTAVSNIKVVLGSVETSNSTTSNTTSATSDVFFPAEGSNSFYIDKIAPKQSVSKTIKLMTSQDVEPGVYAISLTIDYEGGTGGPWETKEQLSFPVNQEQRLDIQGMNLATDAALGDSIPLQFQYINKGKTIIYNFSISVEGGFTLDGGDTYVGNLTAGYNDTFEGTMQAKAEGVQKGTIVMKYENSKGQQKELRKEFSINISPANANANAGVQGDLVDPKTGQPLDPKTGLPIAKKSGILPIILWCVVGAVVIAAAIITIVVIKKKRKAKKELMEDEED